MLIAAVAVIAAIALGMVRGVVPGVLVAVAAGVASTAVWQVATSNRARSAARAARLKEAQRTYALPVPVPEGGVARYLRPEAEVVPFWPRTELGELISWLVSERHIAVQLLTGEGGTGKTRLALRLAEKASEIGWRSQWVSLGTEHGAVGAARDAGEPVLLVVDYAETRSGLQGLLYDVLNDTPGPDMRVLLVVRSAGEWSMPST